MPWIEIRHRIAYHYATVVSLGPHQKKLRPYESRNVRLVNFDLGAGCVPFDPTNRAVGEANLIPVAVARRIDQVALVTGSFHDVGNDLISMDVRVSVEHFAEEARVEY